MVGGHYITAIVRKLTPESRLGLAILSFTAGFADAACFVFFSGLFAAHVTGNIVLLAASLSQDMDDTSLLKIASFPAFVVAVWLTAQISRNLKLTASILFTLEGAILVIVGLVGLLASDEPSHGVINFAMAVAVVFALGIQNQAQVALDTPPTTVMTGNVTRLIGSLFAQGSKDDQLDEIILEISAFTIGCIGGAAGVMVFGLSSFLPVGLILCCLFFGTSKGQI
ncbi:DUF1275 domain-containing protein [Roseobacter sp. YSTF-M11]|uniref:DUF1275 domain-containing protein n=1 Tax=Roseobacter insulae TaxID=2859783 RepID=A0A9X1FRN9_9RHOB|nr:YoaK family protein [Roseobacter insulae]MBW4706383.1 DUF1275 domain-containing protein [Roseobacter insulae]